MPERVSSIIFGDGNHGLQVGQSNAPIHTTFNLPSEAPEPTPAPFASIPFRRDPTFVNRGDILDQIDCQCSELASRVALVGLGGVGKSQLAIEFAHRFADRSPGAWVFWVHASTQARVVEGFKSIADNIKLMGRNQPTADILKIVFDWLSNVRNGKWLLVLDSADNPDVLLDSTTGGKNGGRKLVEYLPQSVNGYILLTTRNRDLAFRLTGDSQAIHEIGPMAQDEALRLLENRLGTLSDANTAVDLVRSLDYIPLAISQAAAYIQMRAPRTSLVQYLDQFRQSEGKRVKLLSYDAGDLRRDLREDGGASNTILTTWQVSFDHIRSNKQSAADLLSLMSFFDRQGIPVSLLAPAKNSHNTARSNSRSNRSDSDTQDSGEETEDGLEDDIATLRDYCLITQSEDINMFQMHGLVQLSTRRWLEAQGLQNKFLEQYITVMASAFPIENYENWTVCRALFAHVEAAATYRPEEEGLKRTWAGLLHDGGGYAYSQARYAVAERMSSKARRAREETIGKDHEETLASMSNLALTYLKQGRWEEAERLQVEVMETSKANLKTDHPDALINMNNLALIYSNQGRWEEAEKLQMEVMETSKVKLGDDHLRTLRSMNNLSSIYWKQGRWEEAEKLQVEVTKTSKTKWGADHPDTLITMHNLARTYLGQGRLEEAEKIQLEVIETSKVKLGDDHLDTLISINDLASIYLGKGRWGEAEKLQIGVVEMCKERLGANHPETLRSMNNLSSTYWKQGREDEAGRLQEKVVKVCKERLGANHAVTLTSINNLALIYLKQGQWEEAKRLQEEVVEMSKESLGADHPATLRSIDNLASIYSHQGRWEEVERLQIEVLEIRKVKLKEGHPDILRSMDDLVSVYWKQGRWEEALRLQVEGMKTRQAKIEDGYPITLTGIAVIALTHALALWILVRIFFLLVWVWNGFFGLVKGMAT